MVYQIRNRTEVKDIVYALHLYFNGLPLRNTSKALSKFVTRSHTATRDWIQKYNPQRLYYNNKTKIFEFILVDESQIKVGSELIWLWVTIEPESIEVLNHHHIHSSYEKSIIERTIQYIKDRTECFDDYISCRKKNCKLKHVQKWLNLFAYHYNKEKIA